jgi:hypothetical protein
MNGSSKRSWLRRLFPVLFVAGSAGLIVGVVSYLRPRPLLSEDDPPDVINRKVLDAYGGQASWERWRSGRTEYEIQVDPGIGPRLLYRETFKLPGKFRREWSHTFGADTSVGLLLVNGDVTWIKAGNHPIEKRPSQKSAFDEYGEIVKFFHPFYLLDGGRNLTVVGTARGNDSGTDLVLNVKYDDVPEPSECRIDVRTGLIREFKGPSLLPTWDEPLTVHFKFAEFKWTSGGLVPHRITGSAEAFKVIEIRVLAIDFDTPVDPASFLPPPDAP